MVQSMSEYIRLRDYAKCMGIAPGSIVFISSDAKKIMWDAMSNGAKVDLNEFIDGVVEAVGSEGTVIFPTYNWSFCGGTAFDYHKTPCKTGTLGAVALKRKDFRRTKHPIYSFAVYGKYQGELCAMENVDSFGLDSPFAFFKQHDAINYIIDVDLEHCFTFTHFAEQHSGVVHHRFIKNFTAGYIDENGILAERTYSMFVRYLDMDVQTLINPIEDDFLAQGVERKFRINSSEIKQISMSKAYDVLMDDILNNRSRKLCTYKGQ